MFTPGRKAIALAALGALAVAGASQAASAAPPKQSATDRPARVQILERPDDRLDRTIEIANYRTAYAHARRAGVAPNRNLAERRAVSSDRLIRATHRMHAAVRRQAAAQAPTTTTTSTAAGSAASYGVSQATLDAIASCESGGDPTAVSPDGTYRGKYQFDESTWASMGGTGDPAAAPESVQDAIAAKLYSEAGSSPWPVCGQ